MLTPTRIELHGPLGSEFGREHHLYVSSPGEAIRALCSQHRGFRERLATPGASYALLVGNQAIPLGGLKLQTGNEDIHLVPVVEGNKDEFTQILIGAAVIVASYYTFGAAGFFTGKAAVIAGQAFMGMGAAMAFGGIAQMLAPSPGTTTHESPQNTPSSVFNGPVNTVSQGHPIQLLYGEMEVGSAVISTLIDNAEYVSDDSTEGGVAADSLITLYGGSTKLASALTDEDLILVYLADGTSVGATYYSLGSTLGTVFSVTAGGKTLEISDLQHMPMSTGISMMPATIAANIELGTTMTLKTGETFTAATRLARTDLKGISFFSRKSTDTGSEDYDTILSIRYYLSNGLPVVPTIKSPSKVSVTASE